MSDQLSAERMHRAARYLSERAELEAIEAARPAPDIVRTESPAAVQAVRVTRSAAFQPRRRGRRASPVTVHYLPEHERLTRRPA